MERCDARPGCNRLGRLAQLGKFHFAYQASRPSFNLDPHPTSTYFLTVTFRSKFNPIEFPFPLPDDYHRLFILEDGNCQHFIEIVGNKIYTGSKGKEPGKNNSLIMDWHAISIMTVRAEFDQE